MKYLQSKKYKIIYIPFVALLLVYLLLFFCEIEKTKIYSVSYSIIYIEKDKNSFIKKNSFKKEFKTKVYSIITSLSKEELEKELKREFYSMSIKKISKDETEEYIIDSSNIIKINKKINKNSIYYRLSLSKDELAILKKQSNVFAIIFLYSSEGVGKAI